MKVLPAGMTKPVPRLEPAPVWLTPGKKRRQKLPARVNHAGPAKVKAPDPLKKLYGTNGLANRAVGTAFALLCLS
jgi:hypothetical protein